MEKPELETKSSDSPAKNKRKECPSSFSSMHSGKIVFFPLDQEKRKANRPSKTGTKEPRFNIVETTTLERFVRRLERAAEEGAKNPDYLKSSMFGIEEWVQTLSVQNGSEKLMVSAHGCSCYFLDFNWKQFCPGNPRMGKTNRGITFVCVFFKPCGSFWQMLSRICQSTSPRLFFTTCRTWKNTWFIRNQHPISTIGLLWISAKFVNWVRGLDRIICCKNVSVWSSINFLSCFG